jgi:hypothetical protein
MALTKQISLTGIPAVLATFRRKIGVVSLNFDQWRDAKRSPSEWPTGSAGRKIAGADLWD